MFKHLLVPLDGSRLAEMILPITETLARALDAEVTLLHVVETSAPRHVHGDTHLLNQDDARGYLETLAVRLRAENIVTDIHVDMAGVGEVETTPPVLPLVPGTRDTTSVVQAIFAHGRELNADLILLTNHGRGGLKQAVNGSIAQQVLQSGAIPVLLVKAESVTPPAPYVCKNILVPLDSSPLYESALDVAADLASALGAMLQLVVIVPTIQTLSPERAATGILLPSSTRAVLDLAEKGATDYLTQKIAQMQARDIHVHARVQRGDIPTQIVAAEQETHIDLLVMATHGRAGLDAFWSGSIAPKVLSHTTAPTILLRVEGPEPVR
jgi:nucleotide-binding universal stress UspA family protein